MKTRGIFVSAVILILAVAIGSAHAEEFYKDKFVTFTVGYSPGGSFDGYTRLLARRMPAHIPGGPKAVVKNLTGAGGLISANYMYNRAPRDGTAIGGWGGALVLQNVLGRKATKFDGRKFGWLGTPAPYNTVCSFNSQSGIKSVAGLVRGQEAGHHRRIRSGLHSVRCTEAAQRGSWIAAAGHRGVSGRGEGQTGGGDG